jgi:hypothetical protein
MNNINVVINPSYITRVNELCNETFNLSWRCPKILLNPMRTTNMSSPWWESLSIYENLCTVPNDFLETLDKEKIDYFTEEEYYKKLSS